MADFADFEFTPAPPDVLERLDTSKIEDALVSFMDEIDLESLRQGRLRWSLEGFDESGLAHVELFTIDGQRISSVEAHWSVIVRDATS